MPFIDLTNGNGLFDSHCHLNDVANLEYCLANASAQGINHFVVPGTQSKQWQEVSALTSSHVSIALGTHPWFVVDPVLEATELERTIKVNRLSAIGEIGLDYYVNESKPRPERDIQQASFDNQLAIASQAHLPVIIHSVKAHNDIIAILKRYPSVTGVIHAFNGSYELAQQYLNLGFSLGIGPILLRSKNTRVTVGKIPLESLLIETDAPYMSNANNPLLNLIDVANTIASVKKITLQEVGLQTTQNAQSLFHV